MIFLGDIASPDPKCSNQLGDQFEKYPAIFSGQCIICNLEGLIHDSGLKALNTPILFNHSSVVSVLKRFNCKAVGLSNNHSLDLPEKFDATIDLLKANGISYTGAGRSVSAAMEPAEFKEGNKTILLFNYTWHVLLQHRKNPTKGVFISTIREKRILRTVSNFRALNPDALIVVYLHWNFDLETLPFPVHRKFARSLIDNGSNLVVGSHSHCVQGGERYKNGYIIYGLGNFFIPWHTYIGGTIEFPDFARIEMAFEWNQEKREAAVHFFKYENTNECHVLELMHSQLFDESNILKHYSPFQGLSDEEYLDYFRKNRRKKLFVPVFANYSNHFSTWYKSIFTIWRMRLARLLARYNLRKWNN
jgi:hypothetical protein